MASPQPKTIAASKPLPEANGDFYMVAETLAKEDNEIRLKVRAFMEAIKTEFVAQIQKDEHASRQCDGQPMMLMLA